MRESANADDGSTSAPLSVIERTSRAIRSMKVVGAGGRGEADDGPGPEDLGALRQVERDLVRLRVDDRAALLRLDAGEVLSRHCGAPVGEGEMAADRRCWRRRQPFQPTPGACSAPVDDDPSEALRASPRAVSGWRGERSSATEQVDDGRIERSGRCRSPRPPRHPGLPHIEVPVAYDAILLAGFGGPEGQDDVIPFLRNVTRGRGIPDERLEEVAHHYRHFGGVSPINAQNRALKAALEAELARRGIDLPVYWGNRNWAPYLDDAVRGCRGIRSTRRCSRCRPARTRSFSSCRQYREDFARVLTDTGLAGTVTIDKVRQFFDHPGFVQPFIDGVRDAVAGFLADGIAPGAQCACCSRRTASRPRMPSAPVRATSTSARAARTPRSTSPSRRCVMAEVAARDPRRRRTSAGSSSTSPARARRSQPWLEPDVSDVIATLPGAGRRGGRDRARSAS